jgi:hypothetical protein
MGFFVAHRTQCPTKAFDNENSKIPSNFLSSHISLVSTRKSKKGFLQQLPILLASNISISSHLNFLEFYLPPKHHPRKNANKPTI